MLLSFEFGFWGILLELELDKVLEPVSVPELVLVLEPVLELKVVLSLWLLW